MSIYGIELLEDNAQLCRNNLADIFVQFINAPDDKRWDEAARAVLETNIIQADALAMKRPHNQPIFFAEWAYLGKGLFQRRDFQYSTLAQRSSFADTIFDSLDIENIFDPKTIYKPMNVAGIAESRR